MHREIEAKILNIDPEIVRDKLKKLGAQFEGERHMQNVIWWIPTGNALDQKSIRVRKFIGGPVRLGMKHKVHAGSGYKEWETDVAHFENTVAIIDELLPHPDLRIEFSHRREDWRLEGALVNLDWFPKVPPLLEIEAESEEQLRALAGKLGFSESDLVDKGIVTLIFRALNLKIGDRIVLKGALAECAFETKSQNFEREDANNF